jgi:hypothetical protein
MVPLKERPIRRKAKLSFLLKDVGAIINFNLPHLNY